jgi:hypothetical protein
MRIQSQTFTPPFSNRQSLLFTTRDPRISYCCPRCLIVVNWLVRDLFRLLLPANACKAQAISDLVQLAQTRTTSLSTPRSTRFFVAPHIPAWPTSLSIASFGNQAAENGGHHGATRSINTFPRTDLENSNTPRAPSRLLGFLRTLLSAQIDPHRPAGYKQNAVTAAFAPPFLPANGNLDGLP